MKKSLALAACLSLFPTAVMAQEEVFEQEAVNEAVVAFDQNESDSVEAMDAVAENAAPEVAKDSMSEAASHAPVSGASVVDVQVIKKEAQYEQIEPVPEDEDGGRGFSFMGSLGPTVAFYERLSTGFQNIDSSAIGGQLTLDLGMRFKYVGVYVEGLIRPAFATKDVKKDHCPFLHNDFCYVYKAHRKGEWDGVISGVGVIVLGFVPITDSVKLVLGGGPLVYIGKVVGAGTTSQEIFALKLELGFQFKLTDKIALGFTLAEEGWLKTYRSFSPAFTMGYNIF